MRGEGLGTIERIELPSQPTQTSKIKSVKNLFNIVSELFILNVFG